MKGKLLWVVRSEKLFYSKYSFIKFINEVEFFDN